MSSMEIFVPGRICLFGEHTDWAGGYRRTNQDLERGYTIIAGTNQGIHARVSPHPSSLIVRSTLDDGSHQGLPRTTDLTGGKRPWLAGSCWPL